MKEYNHNTLSKLLYETPVMVLAVSLAGIPWTAPLYFVYHRKKFYFFSNPESKHIREISTGAKTSVSVFKDSMTIKKIRGVQITGIIQNTTNQSVGLLVTQKYLEKFKFIKDQFGQDLLYDLAFFKEKFKSRLYCFKPESLFFTDNSKGFGTRVPVQLSDMP